MPRSLQLVLLFLLSKIKNTFIQTFSLLLFNKNKAAKCTWWCVPDTTVSSPFHGSPSLRPTPPASGQSQVSGRPVYAPARWVAPTSHAALSALWYLPAAGWTYISPEHTGSYDQQSAKLEITIKKDHYRSMNTFKNGYTPPALLVRETRGGTRIHFVLLHHGPGLHTKYHTWAGSELLVKKIHWS